LKLTKEELQGIIQELKRVHLNSDEEEEESKKKEKDNAQQKRKATRGKK